MEDYTYIDNVENLIEFRKYLFGKKLIKYMYGVESDMRLIYNQYGIRMKNVYDQKTNWQKRPLKEDELMYALSDVKYLFKINDLLIEKIINENKVPNSRCKCNEGLIRCFEA